MTSEGRGPFRSPPLRTGKTMDTTQQASKLNQKLVAVIAIAVGLFHLLNVAGIIVTSTMPIRIIHLMAMMMIVFLTKSMGKKHFKGSIGDKSLSVVFFVLTVFCSMYLLFRWENIANSGGVTIAMDIVVGVIMMVVVLEATRRSVGLVLAVIAAVFLLYPFYGPYLGGLFQTRHYSLTRIIKNLFTTSDGIYGIPISVSANYIILFCIYGAFLAEFGAGQFLFELSSCLTRKFVAASAKTSIIFSAFIGMLTGSAAGNVAVTGSLTIPMMIKEDYTPEEAGAISAVAATGGQIMPPIMGAAAFIMASIIGVPYATVMKAALLPAILYFLSIFIIVDLLAKKKGMKKSDPRQVKPLSETLREGWVYIIPILSLIVMMLFGYSPFKSAFYSIILLLIVYIPNTLFHHKPFTVKRFCVMILESVRKGSMDTVSIATACAAAGIISSVLSVTGLSSKLATMIVSASHGHLIIALLLTMFISLLLGMGLPTTAAYLVLASVVAPALTQMGASLIAAHMFVFYFGCISTITPPVALASYVAAGIAKADVNRVGYKAFVYGIVSFLLPYMFVYGPSLLLEGSVMTIIQSVILAIIGTIAIGMAIVGYVRRPVGYVKRILLIVGGCLMVIEGTVTDLAGLAVFIGVVATTWKKERTAFVAGEKN